MILPYTRFSSYIYVYPMCPQVVLIYLTYLCTYPQHVPGYVMKFFLSHLPSYCLRYRYSSVRDFLFWFLFFFFLISFPRHFWFWRFL
ncbi:hypothetical protein F4810DRAFT_693353 [Camillea tinctor]|nr:hypothetical protein F4810DRAFT_693353 [Camillea tinctor]